MHFLVVVDEPACVYHKWEWVCLVDYWFEALFAGSRLWWEWWIEVFHKDWAQLVLTFFSVCAKEKRGSIARLTANSAMCTCQCSNSWFNFFTVPQRRVSYKLTKQHNLHLSVALANTCWIKQNLQYAFFFFLICDVTRLKNWMKNLDLWKRIFRLSFSGNFKKRVVVFSPCSWGSGLS